MEQGQPDGADLIVTGRAGIDDAARDVEVRLGITVVAEVTLGIEEGDGGGAEEYERGWTG